MRVITTDENGNDIYVFDLTDRSVFADNEWMAGQVEVYNRRVRFQGLKEGEDQSHGWVAVDNIKVGGNENGCPTIPLEAQMTTVPPATTPATTKDPDQFPACKFENGMCGWTSNKDQDDR